VTGEVTPPGGFVLRLPRSLDVTAMAWGETIARLPNGDYPLQPWARDAIIRFETNE
jgi:hypothetical protein